MKPFTILSTFSTNELRPAYFARHVTPDGTTVLVGMAGKFRSFADEAARTHSKLLNSSQFELIRQQALASFRERFAQQKHQPFSGSDDDILRSFGQLIISPTGTVNAFAWGRFQFSSVQNGSGRTELPTVLNPGQYIIGDAEGAGITTTVAQNLAKVTSLDSLTQATGSLADPFMLVTVEVATDSPAPLPVETKPVVPPIQEFIPEPVPVEALPTPAPMVAQTPRPPAQTPVPVELAPEPVSAFPWKAITLFLLTFIVVGSIAGGYYWWKIRPKQRAVHHAQQPKDSASYVITSENGSDFDESEDSTAILENPEESAQPLNESPPPSEAEQLLQQYRNQPDSLMYLIHAAEQIATITDADRQQALQSEIDRERAYRFNEQTQTARTTYDQAVLYLLADQKAKAGPALQTAQRAYEMALLLQPDKADSVRPQLEQVREKINSLNE
jgi:hypothetical protein